MPKEESKTDLSPLKNYINDKCYGMPFDLKNFATPLDLGKYKLAEMLFEKLKQIKDPHAQMRMLFVAYKLNEFLEDPTMYASLSTPLKTPLSNRKDFSELEKASDIFGVEVSAEVEMERLFDLFEAMYGQVTLPQALPMVYTGSSNFFWRSESKLHTAIRSIYAQNMNNKLEKSIENA
jgi:hypothetical protein